MLDKKTKDSINDMIRANEGLIKVNDDLMKEVEFHQSEIRSIIRKFEDITDRLERCEDNHKGTVKAIANSYRITCDIVNIVNWIIGKLYDIRDGRSLSIPNTLDDLDKDGENRVDTI